MMKRKFQQAKPHENEPNPEVTLDWLIANITPENRHEVFDWGPPVGKEIW